MTSARQCETAERARTLDRRYGSPVISELNREWTGLSDDHPDVPARWSEYAALSACTDLDAVLTAARAHPDAVLGALLDAASGGDELASRVVLQAMLGRIICMSARDPHREVGDYVAALWCQIQTYPLARRPQRIPANLALDTLKALHREHRWLGKGEVRLWPPDDFTDNAFEALMFQRTCCGGDDPVDEARAVLAAGRSLSLITDRAHGVLHTIYIDGLSGVAAAARHQTNVGTIRVQCSRAVRRLADHAAVLRDAA